MIFAAKPQTTGTTAMTHKRFRLPVSVSAIALFVGILNAPQAEAACPCLPVAYATTIETSTGAISAGFGMLTLMIQQSFAALNSSLASQSSVIAETSTASTQQLAQIMREAETHRAKMQATNTVDTCNDKASSSRAANIDSNARATQKAIANSMHLYRRNMEESSSGSPGAAAIKTITAQGKMYCDDLEASLGLCTAVGEPFTAAASAGTSQKYNPRGAHVMANTIFGADTLTSERRDAGVVFAKNVTGAPESRPGNNDIRTAAGIARLSKRNTTDARVSTASETFAYLLGLRAELEDKEMKKWADTILKNLTGKDSTKDAGANPDTKGISMQELMAITAEYRFKDSGWLDQVMAMTGEATPLLKQITLMEATMLHHDWKSFELEQRIAANIAASLASKADAAYTPDD